MSDSPDHPAGHHPDITRMAIALEGALLVLAVIGAWLIGRPLVSQISLNPVDIAAGLVAKGSRSTIRLVANDSPSGQLVFQLRLNSA